MISLIVESISVVLDLVRKWSLLSSSWKVLEIDRTIIGLVKVKYESLQLYSTNYMKVSYKVYIAKRIPKYFTALTSSVFLHST